MENTLLGWADYVFIVCIISIWAMLFIHIVLAISGYIYYLKIYKMGIDTPLKKYPSVSIIVPAHNEERVIKRTIEALLLLDYPEDKLEIIVVNDNSNDKTGEILDEFLKQRLKFKLKVITTDKTNGGKGKSNALNIGYKNSEGDLIAVYDADNTPERKALKYLVHTICKDESLGAVIGKFRTRNKNKNILTGFINIETLSFQWMAQAGRWQLFKLCTIPGTNFVIRREVIDKIGGWDIKAIAEDMEISFRIYMEGYKIRYMPLSVTWEQEPERLDIWVRQRRRWAEGNIYVILKNIKLLFKKKLRRARFDVIYFSLIYFVFFLSIVASHTIFALSLLNIISLSVTGNVVLLWFMAFLVFILEIAITLTMEKGESGIKNLSLIVLMYFSYCQLWLFVALEGLLFYTMRVIKGLETKWDKTERF